MLDSRDVHVRLIKPEVQVHTSPACATMRKSTEGMHIPIPAMYRHCTLSTVPDRWLGSVTLRDFGARDRISYTMTGSLGCRKAWLLVIITDSMMQVLPGGSRLPLVSDPRVYLRVEI